MKVKVIDKVKAIILKHPEAADCYHTLEYLVHKQEYEGQGLRINYDRSIKKFKDCRISAYYYMKKEGMMSSPANIRRSSRKCQEMYPETRGKRWKKRQEAQEDTIESLGYMSP
tara:strand:+ start:2076 stop:2414 length:339 start_codon:yes stop_codon:yes gene_type:complete